eukprot:TRINITY_DN2794_c0_g1_i1.p1 TRINITY_DN2794_c0_g1~~TRINITY_DN2794_c0_g1_i1.p1  ORF type:complete len:549 (+),score=147.53 TRINITY_DN2794_c0_g1_i1:2-1648(+)
MQAPVLVLNTNTKRESGRKAQTTNIQAAKAVADIIRTCLGPQSMLKMILDPMGGIVMTNDGNAILREIDVSHPAAKSMIDLSRSQDEEVGDGTTSVIVLAAEMLSVAEPLLQRNMHPTTIVQGFRRALDDALQVIDKLAFRIDASDRAQMLKIIQSSIATKFSNWIAGLGTLICNLALDAVLTVKTETDGRTEIDFKKYARVEKIPGGEISESRVLRGVVLNKDVTHTGMRRRIENPRILLLDCNLEYKKAESSLDVEMTREDDFAALLKLEEDYIQQVCADIIRWKPDLVFTEKGISDLAQHYFVKAGITAFRRLRKTDNNRIARATGATIVFRPDEITEEDIGLGCGLFEVRKIGDEYFCFLEECENPKACTVLLRGANKDTLNEIERNLMDAMNVARNVVFDPRLLPGGGAVEMEVARQLGQKAKALDGVVQYPYNAVAIALEVLPRTLAQNCGSNVIRVMTELRALHAQGDKPTWGIDGNKGTPADMLALGVWDPYTVKVQTIKTAIEAASMLLRIDDVVSGISKKSGGGGGAQGGEEDGGGDD